MPSKDPMRRKLYTAWKNIKMRCYDPRIPGYKRYGARGIKMCDEWLDDFEAFYEWSLANGCKQGLTIDRIDNNRNYEPSNCRWVTQRINSNNREDNVNITYNGKTQTIAEWARELGMSFQAMQDRLNSPLWTVEEALTFKPHERGKTYPSLRKKVNQYDADMNLIATYESVTSACNAINASPSNMFASIKNGWKCRGYYWRYEEER